MDQLIRKCLSCQKLIKGRTDKKFCDDYCRNSHNNQLRSTSEDMAYIRKINLALLKNRRLLAQLLQSSRQETAKTTRDKLLKAGFSFLHYTHQVTSRQGRTYFFCYDLGYLPLENDWLLIVKSKEKKQD